MKINDIKNIISNLTENLKSNWNFYHHAAFLKKMDWTEETYQKQTDPDCNKRATRIRDYYQGYSHLVLFESSQGDPWTRYPSWIQAYNAIEIWCGENCEGKWRTDIHRVIKAPSTGNEWALNEIGGGDVLFFVFKDVNDAFMFKLKWGGGE